MKHGGLETELEMSGDKETSKIDLFLLLYYAGFDFAATFASADFLPSFNRYAVCKTQLIPLNKSA